MPRRQLPVAGAAVLGPLRPRADQDLRHVALGALAPSGCVAPRLHLRTALGVRPHPGGRPFGARQIAFRSRPLGRLALGEEVVVPAVYGHAQTGDLDDPVHAPQQIAVMAHHHRPAVPAAQHLGDQSPRPDIQMIGRLVQQDQVRPRQQQAGEPQPGLFAAAQTDRRPVHGQVRQPDLGQNLGDPQF